MGNRIQVKRRSAAGAPAPGDLLAGELAVSFPAKRLYTKDAAGNVIDLTGLRDGDEAELGRVTTTASTTADPGITIKGARPNLFMQLEGATGGLAFNLMRADLTNLDGQTLENAPAFGVYGSGNTGQSPAEPPILRYVYINTSGQHSDATLKVDQLKRVGINLPGTDRPDAALHVNGDTILGGDVEIDGDVEAEGSLTIESDFIMKNVSQGFRKVELSGARTVGESFSFKFGGIPSLNRCVELRVINESSNGRRSDLAFILDEAGSQFERVRFKHSGEVGIGTSAPTAMLHTVGTVRLQDLPTSNPSVAGALWRDGNDLKISTG